MLSNNSSYKVHQLRASSQGYQNFQTLGMFKLRVHETYSQGSISISYVGLSSKTLLSSDSSSGNLKNCGLTVVLGVGVVTWVQWDRDDTKSEIVKQSFFSVSYGMGKRRR